MRTRGMETKGLCERLYRLPVEPRTRQEVEDRDELVQALRTLKPRQRAALALYAQGYEYSEIGAKLTRSGTEHSGELLVARALTNLAAALGGPRIPPEIAFLFQ